MHRAGVASRLGSLSQNKFLRSNKNIFHVSIYVSLLQREFIVNLISETTSEGGGTVDMASEGQKSSSLVLATAQAATVTRNSAMRNG